MPKRVGRPVLSTLVSFGAKGELVRVEDVRHLANEVRFSLKGDAEAVAAKLSEAMRRFIGNARLEAADAPGISAQWAREVAEAAAKLSGLLGEIEPGNPAHPDDDSGYYALIRNLPFKPNEDRELNLHRHATGRAARGALKVGGATTLSDYEAMGIALVGVGYVKRAAELTAGYWEAKKGSNRSKSHAEITLFRDICAIYREAFGRKAGVSRPAAGGLPGGPTIRFCQAFFVLLPARADEVLDESPRDAAWRARCAALANEATAWALTKLITAGAMVAK